jgi:hypothetical protein
MDDRRKQLNMGLRAAFVAGAKQKSRRTLGRRVTRDELERVMRRYPGDMG